MVGHNTRHQNIRNDVCSVMIVDAAAPRLNGDKHNEEEGDSYHNPDHRELDKYLCVSLWLAKVTIIRHVTWQPWK